jgi:hypothetical protein
MNSSYIWSHCDGIGRALLMLASFEGLRRGIPRCVSESEGPIEKRCQGARGICRKSCLSGFLIL